MAEYPLSSWISLLIESKEANNQLIKHKGKASKVELLESQHLIVKANIKNAGNIGSIYSKVF